MLPRVALWTPNLSMGGAEVWCQTLVTASHDTHLWWTGVAVNAGHSMDADLLQRIAAKCPVFATTQRGGQQDWRDNVLLVESAAEAVRGAVQNSADVLLTWGDLGHLRALSHYDQCPPVICVSHSSHHTPERLGEYRFPVALVAVSDAARRPYTMPGNPPVDVIYNGIDPQRLDGHYSRAQIRALWGVRDDQRVIGYVGRLSPEKNPWALELALSALDDNWCGVRYGDPYNGCPRLAVHDRLLAFRSTSDVGSVYRGLDVLLLASQTEACSLTLIEAWYAGVPVVATRVGAIPELEQQYGQLTVPVRQGAGPRELAAACELAVMQPTFVRTAAALARREFTVQAMVRNWANYISNFLATVNG